LSARRYSQGMRVSILWPDGAAAEGTVVGAPARNLAIRTKQGLFGFVFDDDFAPMFADADITIIHDPYNPSRYPLTIDQPI
jgi:hypothetical protein